jgi:glutamine synthetase
MTHAPKMTQEPFLKREETHDSKLCHGLKTVKDQNVQMIDLRFTDLPGVWQHFSVPPSAVGADALNEGIGFDGSSMAQLESPQ